MREADISDFCSCQLRSLTTLFYSENVYLRIHCVHYPVLWECELFNIQHPYTTFVQCFNICHPCKLKCFIQNPRNIYLEISVCLTKRLNEISFDWISDESIMNKVTLVQLVVRCCILNYYLPQYFNDERMVNVLCTIFLFQPPADPVFSFRKISNDVFYH